MVGTMQLFAHLVRTQRQARNWTTYDLAIRAGVSHQLVSNMEKGKGSTMRKAFAVARTLGINAIPVDLA